MIAVVYTMAKAGSTAVADALSSANLPCYHIHTLNRQVALTLLKQGLKVPHIPPRHVYISLLLRRRLTDRKRCVYISMVRDPIARSLSAYFENYAHFRKQISGDDEDPKAVFTHFLASYPHAAAVSWFDRELHAQLGIDVYQEPFDHAARYAWLPHHNTLIMRADCPDERKSAVLSEIFDTDITVTRSNEGQDKATGPLYAKVKAVAAYDDGFLDKMLDNRFMRHFWSEAELQEMRRRLRSGR